MPPKTVVPIDLAARTACAGRDHQRHHAENEGESRHQNWAKAQAPGLHRRVDDVRSFLTPAFGEFDDQNRVLRRKADQHDEADLRIYVHLHSAHP